MESEYLIFPIQLEIRQRGRSLRGSFPYGVTATRSDRGTVRKERFSSRAFRFAIEDQSREINLLVGHGFDSPIASRKAGNLIVRESAAGVEFEATLPPVSERPSWMQDAVLSIQAGLSRGISPGFKVPPLSTVPRAEEFLPEPGNPGVEIRVINEAVLYELSIVTRPNYDGTSVEVRAKEHETEKPATDFSLYRIL